MKNLGKTIDLIIKIDPSLEKDLTQIKTKWKHPSSKKINYWQKLINYLNSDNLMKHPKRSEIKNVINPTKKSIRKILYSFELLKPEDKILGVIPENIADFVRRHDRKSIQAAKMRIEANLTGDIDLLTSVSRKEAQLEINSKKMWLFLKEYFKLWISPIPCTIKMGESLLYLVENSPILPVSGQNLVKMDSNTFKSFLRFLGIENPPDHLPNDEN